MFPGRSRRALLNRALQEIEQGVRLVREEQRSHPQDPQPLAAFAAHPGRRYAARRQLEIVLEMLPDLHGKRVLAYGDSAGMLGVLLAPWAREFIGLDTDEASVEFARQLARTLRRFNARFFTNDLPHGTFPPQSFDVIIAAESSERAGFFPETLPELHRLLRTDGILMIAAAPARRNEGYTVLTRAFRESGFKIMQEKGAGLSFLRDFLLPTALAPIVLPLAREFEELLNELGIFQRVGALSTIFLLRKL